MLCGRLRFFRIRCPRRGDVLCAVRFFLLGIKSDLVENTGIAALVLLAVHPVQVFDLGFQLSFAACLSIGLFSRFSGTDWTRCCPEKSEGGGQAVEHRGEGSQGRRLLFLRHPFGAGRNRAVAPQRIRLSVGVEPVSQLSVRAFDRGGFAALLAIVLLACLLPSAASVLLYIPSVLWSAALLLFHAADFAPAGIGKLSGGALAAYYAFLSCCRENQFRKTGKICGGIGFSGRFCVFRRDCRGLNDLFPSSFPLRFFF